MKNENRNRVYLPTGEIRLRYGMMEKNYQEERNRNKIIINLRN
jgi:hypothetical protein